VICVASNLSSKVFAPARLFPELFPAVILGFDSKVNWVDFKSKPYRLGRY